jgi:hypothetical protein
MLQSFAGGGRALQTLAHGEVVLYLDVTTVKCDHLKYIKVRESFLLI